MLVHLLLPMLLRQACAVSGGDPGDHKADHNKDHHRVAEPGGVRVLRLWDEPDRPAAGQQGTGCHQQPEGVLHLHQDVPIIFTKAWNTFGAEGSSALGRTFTCGPFCNCFISVTQTRMNLLQCSSLYTAYQHHEIQLSLWSLSGDMDLFCRIICRQCWTQQTALCMGWMGWIACSISWKLSLMWT